MSVPTITPLASDLAQIDLELRKVHYELGQAEDSHLHAAVEALARAVAVLARLEGQRSVDHDASPAWVERHYDSEADARWDARRGGL